MWMFDYLKNEIGVEIIKAPITIKRNGKTLMDLKRLIRFIYKFKPYL